MTVQYYVILLFASLAVLEAVRGNFFHKPGESPADGRVEIIGSAAVVLITQPLIVMVSFYLMSQAFPDAKGVLGASAIWLQIGLLLIFDDMMQYWWHRASHSIPWLYDLHRAHHNAEYLSIRVVYRNNVFYYLLMPSIWFSGILIYLGLGWVFAFYLAIKTTVIFGAHCEVRWDKPLYKVKWLAPVMWVVERTISTPATHSAHHGKHAADGITNYKGNFGNLLFFWDVLFGTAKITRRYPDEFGVENLPVAGWKQQLFWPLAGTAPQTPQELSDS